MENTNINSPSKGKYIGVWFLNSIVGGIAVVAIDNVLASIMFNNIETINDVYIGIIICIFAEIIAALLISIFIYSYFKDLKISRVMPYIYILWTLGCLRAYLNGVQEFEGLDISFAPIGWAFFFAWLILVFGFRFYFRNKDNWA